MKKNASILRFAALTAEQIPPPRLPRWIALGRSNVGKSSFLNTFFHPHKPFKVGRTPGMTRGALGLEWSFHSKDAPCLEWVDLPGWGYAQKGVGGHKEWGALAERLKEDAQKIATRWILLVDPKRKPQEEELQLLEWLGDMSLWILWSKADRFNQKERGRFIKENPWWDFVQKSYPQPLWVSSLKSEGIDVIKKEVPRFLKEADSFKG